MSDPAQSPVSEAAAREPPQRQRIGAVLRTHAGDALRHLLGEDGYESLKGRNWTLIGIVGPIIGIIADILAVFGQAAFWGLVVSAALFVVFLLGAVLRTRLGGVCAFPCTLTLLLAVIFGVVVGAQQLAAANEPEAANRGVLAGTIPGIKEIQDALVGIARTLDLVRDTTDRIADTTERTERKVAEGAETGRRTEQKVDALAEAIARLGTASETEKAALRAEIERLRQTGDIRDQAILTFLRDVGETPLSADQYPAQLARFAERYRTLLAEAERPRNLPAQFEAVRRDAAERIRAGELDKADALLASLGERMARWRREQQAALDQAIRDEAAVLGERAGIAKTRLRYRDAAALFAEAADLVAFDPGANWEFRIKQAGALYTQGEEFGDNPALSEALDLYRLALTLVPRSRAPLDWARTQHNIGSALLRLGERENGTARLLEAVAAYRAALTELTRQRMPFDWAETQHNLGAALASLGERENGTARLLEAVEAYRAALTERTRERVPFQWAGTQNNLGNALASLGERESGTARLEEAVAAYRAALEERTRERAPLDWAMTQNNLGGALARLGERESGTARLEEAVAAYRAALTEWTRERVPLYWAMTQNNLGGALTRLGERESGTARLEEAVAAYRAALEERTRERVPLQWAATQNNLAIAFRLIATRATGDARGAYLEEALAAVDGALAVYRKGNAAYYTERTERLRAGILAEQQRTQAPPR